MDRICQNTDCNKDISHRREIARYCSDYCGNKMYKINNRERTNETARRGYQKNKEEIKIKSKEYVLNNSEKVKESQKKYYEKNKEIIKSKKKKYYAENKEKISLRDKIWRKNNKGIVNSNNAKRRTQKLKATPKWADLELIKQFYKNCPKGYHVDHIIPLKGKKVCGLHVIDNLQYLTASENCRKSNKVIL